MTKPLDTPLCTHRSPAERRRDIVRVAAWEEFGT